MFITFEGTEGTGKTTLIKKIKEQLLIDGYDVIYTREPGGGMISEKIRSILLDPQNHEITPHTEALLFASSRAQHIDEIIKPALDKKKIVLCDRYLDSSLAYQAYGRDLGLDFVLKINTYALQTMPNITFYIDLDPNIGVQRVKSNRSHKVDRLDLATIDFHKKVREGYLELTKLYKDRIRKIDGDQSIDDIYTQIIAYIKEELCKK